MKQKPKTCQGCKFYFDTAFVVNDYTPYFSMADRGKVETLLNSGDYGRCIRHSQMFPELEQEDLPVRNLIVVSSAVSICVVVKWLWKCDDWEKKKSEKRIEWGEPKDKKPISVIAAST